MNIFLNIFLASGAILAATCTTLSQLNDKCEEYKKQFTNASQQWNDNGNKAHLGEFPHIVALGYEVPDTNIYRFRCGGSLISDKYIVFPAHCAVTIGGIRPKFARLGAVDMPSEIQTINRQNDYLIKSIIVHPKYNMRKQKNNIALAQLEKKVTFTNNIRPACLYLVDGEITASEFILSEWGQHTNSVSRLKLHKTKATYVPTADCSVQYTVKFNKSLVPGQMCAYSNISDTCEGELGGPLQIYNGKLFTLVGVQSHGGLCGTKIPTVYTFVYDYLDWIKENVWN